jgi:hypothetical protein
MWREDSPMRRKHLQWIGGSLRYRFERSLDIFQASVRAGWTPGDVDFDGAGWSWYASLRAALGPRL